MSVRLDDRMRSRLAALAAALTLFAEAGPAAAGWRAIPTTAFVTDDLDLTLARSQSSLSISSQVATGRHEIFQTVPSSEGDVIDAIAVCYTAPFGTGDRATPFITAIGLTEFLFPGISVSRHFDDTDLTSRTDTCYVAPVANYAPAGAVSLFLRLDFDVPFPPFEFVFIGAVFMHVK